MIVDEYIKFTEAKQEEKKINEKINKSVENITKSIKTFIETNFDDNKSWFRGMEYDFGWGLNILGILPCCVLAWYHINHIPQFIDFLCHVIKLC